MRQTSNQISLKILLNSTSILWLSPERRGHLSKRGSAPSTLTDAACAHGTPLCPVGRVPQTAAPEPCLHTRNSCPLTEGCSSKYRGEIRANMSQNQWFSWADNWVRFQRAWKSKLKGGKWNGHLFPPDGFSQVLQGLLLQSTCLCVNFFRFQFCGKNCDFYQQSTTASKQQRNSPWGIWESLSRSTESTLGS